MNTYCNPIQKQGDFADPFVLRCNGRYYLYATNPDIRCWSSENLVDWRPEGAVIGAKTFPGLVPFAPEVVYHNGFFYMYTSPSGQGHYVLRSSSPTGPFQKITGNVGHNIDGSVLIDEDGQWYFYWAADSGILGCRMPSPDKFGEAVSTGAYLHGWTEGPMVVKKDGLYYMTFTGNHYLSAGYRVHAAVSERPLGPYRACENNPILVHTAGRNIGLGHSSTVLGPDLQHWYIVYHNMNPDRTRDLNIDVLAMEKGRVHAAGPSRTPQPVPAAPLWRADPREADFSGKWTVTEGLWEKSGAFFVSRGNAFCGTARQTLPCPGDLECSFRAAAGRYGIRLGAGRLQFLPQENTVSLLDAGGRVQAQAALPAGYRHEALHCVRLHCGAQGLQVHIDAWRPFGPQAGWAEGDAAGLYAQGGTLAAGCVVISDAAKAPAPVYEPLPCEISARETVALDLPETQAYHLTLLAGSVDAPRAQLTCLCEGRQLLCRPSACTGDCADYILTLPRGRHILELQFEAGVHMPRRLLIYRTGRLAHALEGTLRFPGAVGKSTLDMPAVSACSARLAFAGKAAPQGEIGLLLRADELACGGEGSDERLGADFLIGYSAAWKQGRLVLSRHRFDRCELASVPVPVCRSIEAKAVLNEIQVFCNDAPEPVIRFRDTQPILWGRVGARAIDWPPQELALRAEQLTDGVPARGGKNE